MNLISFPICCLFICCASNFAAATVGVTNTLVARNAREQWETIFNRHYIQPVVESLEQKVSLAMQTILEDDDQGYRTDRYYQ